MSNRFYIDINSQFGKRSKIVSDSIPYSIDDCVRDHIRHGIDKICVTSSKAIPYSVFVANNEVIEIAKQNDSIIPVATLYPGIEYDIEDIDKYLLFLQINQIKAISLDLSKLFIFRKNFFNKIYEFAEKNSLSILIDWDSIEEKNNVFDLIKEYKELKVIITNVNWSFKKYIFEYMRDNPNIHIGVNGFIYQDMIEDVCKRFSSKRLFFASGYPFYSIGSAKAMVEYASISEEEKDDIAYKNAQKLFDITLSRKVQYNQDRILNCIDNGLSIASKLSTPIIDSHTHFIDSSSKTVDWIGSDATFDSLVASSKKIGVSIVFASPIEGLVYDGIIGNRITDKAISSNRGIKIYGYVTMNPYYIEDKELALHKLNDSRYIGIKLYPSKNWYSYDGKLYEEVLLKTRELGKYFLLHATPKEARKVLEKYKGLNVILAHSTQSYEFMDETIELLREFPNLSIDICNRYAINGAIEYLVDNIGAERILFGSDSALLSQTSQLGWLGYSDISLEDKEKILSTNALRLIKRGLL